MKARYTFRFAFRGLNSKGKGKVDLEVYISREHRKVVDTGLRLFPSEWDGARQAPHTFTNDGKMYLKTMLDLKEKIEKAEFDLIMRGENLTTERINQIINGGMITASSSLCGFIDEEIKRDNKLQYETKKSHRQTLAKLKAFRPNASVRQVDYTFLIEFDRHLRSLGLHENTIEGHHRRLRKYLNVAINRNMITDYPYKRFKLKKVPTNKLSLTEDDLDKIATVDYSSNQRLLKTQMLFLFACYTGLRYGELFGLKNSDCEFTPDGWEINLHEIRKYPTPVFLPLWALFDGKPQKIFTEYLLSPMGLKMPKFANSNVNLYLKEIAHDSGVVKPMSFHIARHTFGTLIGATTGDAFLVKSLMGHKDLKTSMIYVKSTPEIIRKKLKKVSW